MNLFNESLYVFENAGQALENYRSAWQRQDHEEVYRVACGLEQALADSACLTTEPLSLVDWRTQVTRYAATLFGSSVEPTFEELPIKPLLEFIKYNPTQVKIPECLVHFGVLPEDYFNTASALEVEPENTLVVGIRSAGSILAPAVAAATASSYLTVRPPTGNASWSSSDVQDCELIKLRRIQHLLLVDEGPGSGATFRSTSSWLNKRAPQAHITIIHHRPMNPLPGCSNVHVESHEALRRMVELQNSFVKLGPTKVNICNKTHWSGHVDSPRLSKQSTLHWYQSPKMHFEGGLVGKFVGYGRYGDDTIHYHKALAGFMPPLVAAGRGVLLQRYCPEPLTGFNKPQQQLLMDYIVASNEFRQPALARVNDYLIDCSRLLDAACHITGSLSLVNSAKKLNAIARSIDMADITLSDIDWKLEAENWRWSNTGFYKLDAFHCQDYTDAPRGDALLLLAGAALEFPELGAEKSRLYSVLEQRLNRIIPQEYRLALDIFYCAWKLHHYMVISSRLSHFAVDPTHINERVETYHNLLNELILYNA